MFGSSVVYPVERLGGRLADALALNPMTPIIESYRAVLVRGEAPDPAFAAAGLAALVTFGGAWLLFHRAEPRFAEVI
jgi:ABC-type polysaccharide/polyol phosphate export permease